MTAMDFAHMLLLLQKLSDAQHAEEDSCSIATYTTVEMFTKKTKNARSTAAQNYLLVSV